MSNHTLQQFLFHLPLPLIKEIEAVVQIQEIPQGTEILREGQYVRAIPLVIEGLVKVFSRYEDRELLLYYIQPKESCIISFSSGISNSPSKGYAITETDTKILLLPVDKVAVWTRKYPEMNALFFANYNLRYLDLLDTVQQLVFDKLDKRVVNYLNEHFELTGVNPLKITHKKIAIELGSAREVISRVLKKLEHEGIVKQHHKSIELLVT